MFTIAHRDAARDHVVAMARADSRIRAAAVVGSLVTGGDRWSDLDLTHARTLSRDALLAALTAATDGLLREADGIVPVAARVGPRLRELLD